MTTPILIAIIAATLTNLVVLLGLVRAHSQLKQQNRTLKKLLQSITNDMAGLCSAAVMVDNRIVTTDEQLKALLAKMSEFQKTDSVPHPYSTDIQKVRSGASIHDLMQSSGLSHDEAALLIRLHGTHKST
ncbi:MAG: DUF2802 domain-containing protein [Methylococcaceae bacterium]|nr:DUF2802 domain-containing protein [Methylococcaceae bacterium]